MNRMVGYEWHLPDLLHQHRLSATSDLRRLLAERGVDLSGTHVYRLVNQPPERISLTVLAALCDIFGCELADLITVTADAAPRRRAAGADVSLLHDPDRPARARIWQPADE